MSLTIDVVSVKDFACVVLEFDGRTANVEWLLSDPRYFSAIVSKIIEFFSLLVIPKHAHRFGWQAHFEDVAQIGEMAEH